MSTSIIVQQPSSQANSLVLLFHGVGATAHDMTPLGQAIASANPSAWVVSVSAPFASDLGRGRQWFSVLGITESNRTERIAAAMPSFAQCVQQWQLTAAVDAHATTLVGFSQGAIMSLAATARHDAIAHRVVSIAGRYAASPVRPAADVAVHFIHGTDDRVIPAALSQSAYGELRAGGSSVTLELLPALGHSIDARVANYVLQVLGLRD
jgi:phospholipase/carboxylesterase